MELDEKQKLAYDYAWKWFEYHAGQRLTTFRFFLIFLGICLIGYQGSIKESFYLYSQVISIMGGIVTLTFLALEYRNEQLVKYGIEALKDFEQDVVKNISYRMMVHHQDKLKGIHWIFRHGSVFKTIYIMSLLAFICLYIYAETMVGSGG